MRKQRVRSEEECEEIPKFILEFLNRRRSAERSEVSRRNHHKNKETRKGLFIFVCILLRSEAAKRVRTDRAAVARKSLLFLSAARLEGFCETKAALPPESLCS